MPPEQEFLATPKPPPNLNIPPSSSTVSVSIIDTGARFSIPLTTFLTPALTPSPRLTGPAYSFLITHGEDKMLFDLGIRTDYATGYAPAVCKRIADPANDFRVSWARSGSLAARFGTGARDVPGVLEAGGAALGGVGAVVWSHHHWDHTGDVARFPASTRLVVGPGFEGAFGEGWPRAGEECGVRGREWEGRPLVEVAFEDGGLRIGRFGAKDWFGDGSFYLLDTPGHAVGHLCGLARVKAAGEGEAFVFMGGDCAHHPGEFRPSDYLPLPALIDPSPLPYSHVHPKTLCPGALFQSIHPSNEANTPFYTPTKGFPLDYDQCMWSIKGLQEFDADERVLVINAHDESLLGVFQGQEVDAGENTEGKKKSEGKGWIWPEGRPLDGWREAGLGQKGRWKFLGDFTGVVGVGGEVEKD